MVRRFCFKYCNQMMIVHTKGGGIRWPPSMATLPFELNRRLGADPFAHVSTLPLVIPSRRHKWQHPPSGAPEWWDLQADLLVDILSQLSARELLRLRRLSVNTRQCATRALERVLKLSPEQTVAFCDAVCGRNVFLSGGAGKLLNLQACPTACTAHRLCCPA
jgi:hypothetical protein